MTAPIGWLLTMEPFGASIGWSLLRNDGETDLVGTGVIEDGVALRQAANTQYPVVDAGPGADGRAGLWASALTRPDDELRVASLLGKGLLPERLRAYVAKAPRHANDPLAGARRTSTMRGQPPSTPVSTRTPIRVMATVCSTWQASDPSPATTVHPSSSAFIAGITPGVRGRITIGSTVTTIPGRSTKPSLGPG